MLAGVITQKPTGTRDSQTGSDDFTLQPPGCWFPSGLHERSYYHYKSGRLFVSFGSHSYYFTLRRLKQDHCFFNIFHNPPSTIITHPLESCKNIICLILFWSRFLGRLIFWMKWGEARSDFPRGGAPGCRKESCRLITPAWVSHVWGSRERGNPFTSSKEEIHTLGIR